MATRLGPGALVLAVTLAATGCGRASRGPSGEPRFAKVVVSDNKESGVENTVFTRDSEKIYLTFNLADVPSGTAVKSVWIAEKTQEAPPDYKIDEVSLSAGGSKNTGMFSLSRPNKGWPAGDYRVELFLGDRLAHTARFRVEAPASEAQPSPAAATEPAPGSSNAQLGPIIFARGESNTQPVGQGDRFEAGVKAVYAFFNFEGLKTEDTVTGTWFRGTKRLASQRYKMSVVFGDTPREKGHLWMHVTFDDGAPAGSYRLEIRVNDNLAQSGSFAIDPK